MKKGDGDAKTEAVAMKAVAAACRNRGVVVAQTSVGLAFRPGDAAPKDAPWVSCTVDCGNPMFAFGVRDRPQAIVVKKRAPDGGRASTNRYPVKDGRFALDKVVQTVVDRVAEAAREFAVSKVKRGVVEEVQAQVDPLRERLAQARAYVDVKLTSDGTSARCRLSIHDVDVPMLRRILAALEGQALERTLTE